jgi:FdhD protein
MTEINETEIKEVQQFQDGVFSRLSKEIIREIHLEINLNAEKIAVIACSGRYADELAAGFLRSEGLLSSRDEIEKIEVSDTEHKVNVWTRKQLPITLSSHKTIASSGARGTGAGPALTRQPLRKPASRRIKPEDVFRMMEEFLSLASLHDSTGGTHAAALADCDGGIIAVREDIGRHNTIDMLGGYALLNGIDLADKTVVRTGRVSSEIVHKVWRLGAPVVISISVPTAMAIELADEAGITLVGSVRGKKLIIYTHAERILVS